MRPSLQVRPRRAATPVTRKQRVSARQPRPRAPCERPGRSQDGLGSGLDKNPHPGLPGAGELDQHVHVCVRVRPMATESEGQVVFCDLDAPGSIHLKPERTGKQETFMFDTVLPSSAGQAAVYNLIGSPVLHRLMSGYHGCILAFGPTGCGKSHTIFGMESRGLLPRIAEKLLEAEVGSQKIVKLSYLELYNEKVRDLLQPDMLEPGKVSALEVREHPKVGIFVDGLTRNAVSSVEDVLLLLEFGHKMRVLGSTHYGQSSRAHAIATLYVEQVLDSDGASSVASLPGQRVRRHSQLQAVDLAGAERLGSGSLAALGNMVSTLSRGPQSLEQVPYRSSKLTCLLANSLMGNCHTSVVACVSPRASYEELTGATLHFASQVRKIKTHGVKNEELHGDMVQSLRTEVSMLKRRLAQGGLDQAQARSLEVQLRCEQYLQEELGLSAEEVQERAKSAERLRRRTLRQLGLRFPEVCEGCVSIVNVSVDPLLSGRLTWAMAPGEQFRIGSEGCEISVDGLGVEAEMCRLHCSVNGLEVIPVLPEPVEPTAVKDPGSPMRRRRSLFKKGQGMVLVNGTWLEGPHTLHTGDLLRVGRSHFFRVVIPTEGETVSRRAEDVVAIESTFGVTFAQDSQRLRERVAGDTEKVLHDLKSLKLAVDEANALTEELRGNQELVFKGNLLLDPLENEEPSLVVSLRSVDGDALSRRSNLIATWSLPEFEARLEAMRDIYDEVRLRDFPWGQPGDVDLWQAHSNIVAVSDGSPRTRTSRTGSPSRFTPRASIDRQSYAAPPEPSFGPCSTSSLHQSAPSSPRVAQIMQQLPALHAELAKAHEAQGVHATELEVVRKELEDLRLSIARQTTSPARRPGDSIRLSGTVAEDTSQPKPSPRKLSSPKQSSPRERGPCKVKISPRRWQSAPGARTPATPVAVAVAKVQVAPPEEPSPVSPSFSRLHSAEEGSQPSEPVPGSLRQSLSHLPPRSAERAGSTMTQSSSLSVPGSAVLRQYSAPVSVRTLPPRLVTGYPSVAPPPAQVATTVVGWPYPAGRSNPATPRVQVAPPRYVQPVLVPTPRSYQATPSYTAQVQSARSHSSSPNPHGASVNLRPPEEPFAARATPPVPSVPPRVASPAVTAVSTPRFTNEVDAMAQAAAQAVAKAAPGMSIVVRPVSQTQAAMLAKRHATPAEDASCPFCNQKIFADAVFCRHCGGKLREDPDASKAPDLRSCQVEIAGLKKQVDSLGRACRGFQL